MGYGGNKVHHILPGGSNYMIWEAIFLLISLSHLKGGVMDNNIPYCVPSLQLPHANCPRFRTAVSRSGEGHNLVIPTSNNYNPFSTLGNSVISHIDFFFYQ